MAYNITDKCNGCTACSKLCPVYAITGQKSAVHVINQRRCVNCGICGHVCQSHAIVNSEGQVCVPLKRSLWPKPVINKELCSACSICVCDCTPRALRISMPKFRGDINVFCELANPQKCIGCAICESRCPMGAVKMAASK